MKEKLEYIETETEHPDCHECLQTLHFYLFSLFWVLSGNNRSPRAAKVNTAMNHEVHYLP